MAGVPSRAGSAPARRGSPQPWGHLGSLLLDVVADILRLDVAQARYSPALVVARVGRAVIQRRLGQLLGHDLDHRPGAAVLSGPSPCWSRPTTTTGLPG